MRYLKKYKIFESNDINVREDLTEICYELTDGRFDIKIYDNNVFPDNILCINLSDYRDYDGFSFDEVREVILRIVDYLGDRYKGCSVLSVSEHERSSINRREIVEHVWFGNLSSLIIIYK